MSASEEKDKASEGSVLSTVAEVLPVPANTAPVTNPSEHDTANSLREEPTLSHSLAMEDHDEKGFVQIPRDEEVADLGWNEKKENIPAPLVGGLGNEDLWLLIRRFNKQMYHVKEIPYSVPGDLDLNISDEEEFSPDKLRATVERFYMTVVIGLLATVKHIARLRSWRETRRTSYFCAAYFIAWLFDFITPLLAVTLISLIVYPRSRGILFPPAPISLVDAKSGGVQKPKAGVLGSHESATGAPENHKGEAVEQEAANFFNGFTAVVVTSATGKHPQANPHPGKDNSPDDHVPDPTGLAVSAAEAKDVAAGGQRGSKHDKTKVPVENAIWSKMRPVMHGISDVSDTWERLANALSPTPPFPQNTYRIRIACLIVPLLLASLFTTSYMFVKLSSFGAGFGFFGDPIITPGLRWLNRQYPHWEKILEMRNTVLKGVPTNAQLTLTLLRTGEANKAPLPPAPLTRAPAPDRPAQVTDAELRATGAEPPLNATDEELDAAMEHDPQTAHETAGADIDAAKSGTHGGKGHKIIGAVKSAVKGTVKSAIASDAARAKAGSRPAKNRLGAVPPANAQLLTGPVDFKGRYNGKKGRVYITTKATIPAIGFSTDAKTDVVVDGENEALHPSWSIAIGDIKELKKIGGYGWKAKLVIGWSLGREVNDGLEITDRLGNVRRITALPLRDELFNRLVAMGGQKWEAW
ncbi:hypothetical protein F5B22DRAFT_639951 [Xylaria bambusicola]|uniref:uncharacterized protein n=1 Tax=Xylaria bambusicola TaxID=326684 RepID=UPI0020085CF7|nr:uncharacterized protein F5B22DRAFT_639951 [Xylaria bambusicola]KAI0505401.1 hypothetical protein F5B22DRAFT_639951 [Xylaria bambusicola]